MSDNLQRIHLALSSEIVVSARAWRRTADQALSAFGISSSSALPLLMIGRLGDDGVRQVTLAQAVGIEGPSLVRVLDQLCAAQLVRRDEDPADGRAKIVSLTRAGQRMVKTIECQLSDLRARILEGVSDTELETALRVIRRFTNDTAAGVPAAGVPAGTGASTDASAIGAPVPAAVDDTLSDERTSTATVRPHDAS
ncbi:MAG: MarR family winged helix-turn-helix transcriptional regulator [Janthinobacterium lividum]